MSFTNIEYQHFIPQFILRNYSYPFKCPKAEHQEKKKCKCKHEKGKYPGDAVVNCVDLSHSPFRLETYSVKRIFGASNMYSDPSATSSEEQRRIETMFSKMESQASTIFRRITKTHESGGSVVTLTRIERDLIRKFLFLLKYRGRRFHQRFYHDNPEGYSSNDREELLEYMTEHGFSSPRDVWYHNIETIINLEMDPDYKWAGELQRKMFHADAAWFFAHAEHYYMALCTPSEASDEFILTDNSYNVFEGPNTFVMDESTGQIEGTGHAGFHEFAPVSPRLIIVLRSSTLPIPEEDYDVGVSQMRHDAFWSSFQNVFGSSSKSMLEDLPITKCRNSRSEIVNGMVRPVSGHDGKFRPNDKFHFSYYDIKNDHVRIINGILLDNAFKNSLIAFRSQESFKKILETYVSGPCDSHKIVGGHDWKSQYTFLRGLETLAKLLGSQKSLVWRIIKVPRTPSIQPFMEKRHKFQRIWSRYLSKGHHYGPMSSFYELYGKLDVDELAAGGHYVNLTRDLAQAGKMVRFQLLVEYLGLDCNPMIQERNLAIIHSIFKASYCSRYWLYVKLLRKAHCGDQDLTQDVVDIFVNKDIREGPEDVFAQTSQLYTENTLNELMQVTGVTDIEHRMYKIENLWKHAFGTKDIYCQALFHSMIFYRPGKIRKCGIPVVELLAEQEEKTIRRKDISFHLPFADEDEHLELMVRVNVRSKFLAAMKGKAEDSILRELKDVFFRLTFPTPPLD